MRHDKIHKVIGHGNFVIVMSEGEFGGRHAAFYDLFRVENGAIVEHWDVIQEIPKGRTGSKVAEQSPIPILIVK